MRLKTNSNRHRTWEVIQYLLYLRFEGFLPRQILGVFFVVQISNIADFPFLNFVVDGWIEIFFQVAVENHRWITSVWCCRHAAKHNLEEIWKPISKIIAQFLWTRSKHSQNKAIDSTIFIRSNERKKALNN